MNRRGAIADALCLAAGAALALAPPARAAPPVEGVWSGTLEQHDDAPTKVKCAVTRAEDGTLDAVLLIYDSPLPLNKFQVSKNRIRFSFRPGETELKCRLEADPSKEGGFAGTCPPGAAPDDPDAFRLRMSRPKPAREEPLATVEPAGGAAKSEEATSKAESRRGKGKGKQTKQGSEEGGSESD